MEAFPSRLDPRQATLVYSMFHHLGDFVVMSGLLRFIDYLEEGPHSLIVHSASGYIPSFAGKNGSSRFFNLKNPEHLLKLIQRLRREKKSGKIIFGLPMAPGSIQAHLFFSLLKKLNALTYVVDFNLINADLITPPRARYIFDRQLAQAAQLFRRPAWSGPMPLGLRLPIPTSLPPGWSVGLHPWSARSGLPEFRLPEPYWLELTRHILNRKDARVFLFGRDPSLATFGETLRSALTTQERARFLIYPTANLDSLLAFLQSLDLVITVNTGVLHLAHALQKPLLGLCGSSLDLWCPEGPHVRLVRDENAPLPPSDLYRHDPLQPSLQNLNLDEIKKAYSDLESLFSN